MSAVQAILNHFTEISSIPRKSGEEAQLRDWLIQWAVAHDLKTKTDDIGNLVVLVPGTPSYEHAPTVVLQGHLDMVCEKTPQSNHNFLTDPIELLRDGDWLTANQTTLGADNGIAIAMSLAIISQQVPHPPLELLFTVDEETGLTGATELSPSLLTGNTLLNIDSEDEGVLTVGCAGGQGTHLHFPLDSGDIPPGAHFFRLKIGGLFGGHSGVDIHLGRANALSLLGRLLRGLLHTGLIQIGDISGGSAHNAIARDASVSIATADDLMIHSKIILSIEADFKREFAKTDPNLHVQLIPQAPPFKNALHPNETARIADLLIAIPHGVSAMSSDIDGLVQTSNNLATVELKDHTLIIQTSQRSSIMSERNALTDRIEAFARLGGGGATTDEGYPAWQPNMDSTLLKRCQRIYQARFNKPPVIEIIHAGLECGVIGSKYPQMDMISLGPTIQFPHCPDERLNVPSLEKTWDYLVDILADLAQNP